MTWTNYRRYIERLGEESNDEGSSLNPIFLNWILQGKLAQSSFFGITQLDAIKKEGIKAIVSLVQRDDVEIIKQKGFIYFEEYIVDFTPPTIEQLFRICEFIDSMIQEEKPVLVHCIAAGRSGTAIAGYLIYKGQSYESAVSDVKRKIDGATAIETPSQFKKLKEFALIVG